MDTPPSTPARASVVSLRAFSCRIESTESVHDLYLRFSGEGDDPLLAIDSFKFE